MEAWERCRLLPGRVITGSSIGFELLNQVLLDSDWRRGEQVQQVGQDKREKKTMGLLTGHANAAKSAAFVDAGPLVLAGVRFALVDVHFTSAAFEAGAAVALVGAGQVHASPAVLARRACEIKMMRKVHWI